VTRLMREEGVIGPKEKPSKAEVLRYDRKRKDKTVSNAEWKSEVDEDAKIARMKDGTTHLAYKAEHVVDLDSDLVLAAEIGPATAADTTTLPDSLVAAQLNLKAAGSRTVIEEAAGDKGYHAAATIEMCDFLDVRTYIPEPKTAESAKWPDKPEEQRRAALNNRCRMKRPKGKAMQRRRSEVVERTFAHICETGGSRRSHLRGLVNVTKRYLIAVAAHNLGRILRRLTGIGKPKALQGSAGGFVAIRQSLPERFRDAWAISRTDVATMSVWIRRTRIATLAGSESESMRNRHTSTGC
jgi:Transposase DDE domain